MTAVIIGAYEDAATAIAALAPVGGKRRAAVLPRAAVDDEARVRLRQAQVECLSTLDGGDLPTARALANTTASNVASAKCGAKRSARTSACTTILSLSAVTR